MQFLNELLSSDAVHHLGWMLLHSLWLMLIPAVLLGLLLFVVPKRMSSVRYVVSTLSLLLMAGSLGVAGLLVPDRPVMDEAPSQDLAQAQDPAIGSPLLKPLTPMAPTEELPADPDALRDWIADSNGLPFDPATAAPPDPQPTPENIHTQPKAASGSSEAASGPAKGASGGWYARTIAAAEPYVAWAVPLWLGGVVVLGLWHLGGLIATHRLRSIGARPAPYATRLRMQSLMRQMGITRTVHLLESSVVQAPMVIGFFKPVILLPTSVFTGLTPEQLEAILAHELAHVRRHDYLVNLLQTLIVTLLFYHPAVWWVSRMIRNERECCCDDIVVKLTPGKDRKLDYAKALTQVAMLRNQTNPVKPGLAVAADSGSLFERIKRMMGVDDTPASSSVSPKVWLAGLLVMLFTIALPIALAAGQSREILTEAEVDIEEVTEEGDAAEADIAPTIEQVIEIIERRIEQTRQYTAKFESISKSINKESGEVERLNGRMRLDQMRNGEQTWHRVRVFDPDEQLKEDVTFTNDGYWHRSLGRTTARIRSDRKALFSHEYLFFEQLNGRLAPAALEVQDGKVGPLDISLIEWIDYVRNNMQTRWSVSEVEDQRFPEARLIDLRFRSDRPFPAGLQERYLFDPQRGGMLVYWEQTFGTGDRMHGGFLHVMEARKIGDIWVPDKIRRGVLSTDPNMPSLTQTDSRLIEYQSDQPDKAKMKISFPVGVQVIDEVNDAYYRVEPGFKLKPLQRLGKGLTEITPEVIDAFHGVIPKIGDEQPEPPDSTKAILGKWYVQWSQDRWVESSSRFSYEFKPSGAIEIVMDGQTLRSGGTVLTASTVEFDLGQGGQSLLYNYAINNEGSLILEEKKSDPPAFMILTREPEGTAYHQQQRKKTDREPRESNQEADLGPDILLELVAQTHRINASRIKTWVGSAIVTDESESPTAASQMTSLVAFQTDRNQGKRWRWEVTAATRTVDGEKEDDPFQISVDDEMIGDHAYYKMSDGFKRGEDGPVERTMVILPVERGMHKIGMKSRSLDPFWYLTFEGKPIDRYLDQLIETRNRFGEEVRVTREDSVILIENPVKERQWVQRYRFDLAQGGNLIQVEVVQGESFWHTDISYEQINGVWVPKRYEQKQETATHGMRRRVVVFRDQLINHPVDQRVFTMEAMGILPGTRVADHMRGLAYEYPNEEDARRIRYSPPTGQSYKAGAITLHEVAVFDDGGTLGVSYSGADGKRVEAAFNGHRHSKNRHRLYVGAMHHTHEGAELVPMNSDTERGVIEVLRQWVGASFTDEQIAAIRAKKRTAIEARQKLDLAENEAWAIQILDGLKAVADHRLQADEPDGQADQRHRITMTRAFTERGEIEVDGVRIPFHEMVGYIKDQKWEKDAAIRLELDGEIPQQTVVSVTQALKEIDFVSLKPVAIKPNAHPADPAKAILGKWYGQFVDSRYMSSEMWCVWEFREDGKNIFTRGRYGPNGEIDLAHGQAMTTDYAIDDEGRLLLYMPGEDTKVCLFEIRNGTAYISVDHPNDFVFTRQEKPEQFQKEREAAGIKINARRFESSFRQLMTRWEVARANNPQTIPQTLAGLVQNDPHLAFSPLRPVVWVKDDYFKWDLPTRDAWLAKHAGLVYLPGTANDLPADATLGRGTILFFERPTPGRTELLVIRMDERGIPQSRPESLSVEKLGAILKEQTGKGLGHWAFEDIASIDAAAKLHGRWAGVSVDDEPIEAWESWFQFNADGTGLLSEEGAVAEIEEWRYDAETNALLIIAVHDGRKRSVGFKATLVDGRLVLETKNPDGEAVTVVLRKLEQDAQAIRVRRRVVIPDMDEPGGLEGRVLDLRTGELLDLPPNPNGPKIARHFNELEQGDLMYERAGGKHYLGALRGATIKFTKNAEREAVKPNAGRMVTYELLPEDQIVLVRTAEGDEYPVAIVERNGAKGLELEVHAPGDDAAEQNWEKQTTAATHRVVIPDVDESQGKGRVLDLKSGEFLGLPSNPSQAVVSEYFNTLGQGDLMFDQAEGAFLITLRGATLRYGQDFDRNENVKFEGGVATHQLFPGDEWVQVITAEGGMYMLRIIENHKSKGIEVVYAAGKDVPSLPGEAGAPQKEPPLTGRWVWCHNQIEKVVAVAEFDGRGGMTVFDLDGGAKHFRIEINEDTGQWQFDGTGDSDLSTLTPEYIGKDRIVFKSDEGRELLFREDAYEKIKAQTLKLRKLQDKGNKEKKARQAEGGEGGDLSRLQIIPASFEKPGEDAEAVNVPGQDRPVYRTDEAMLDLKDVTAANQMLGEFGQPVLNLKIKPEAARRLEAYTREHIGGPLLIVIDNEPVSAPTVRARLRDRIQVSGSGEAFEASIKQIIDMVEAKQEQEGDAPIEQAVDADDDDQAALPSWGAWTEEGLRCRLVQPKEIEAMREKPVAELVIRNDSPVVVVWEHRRMHARVAGVGSWGSHIQNVEFGKGARYATAGEVLKHHGVGQQGLIGDDRSETHLYLQPGGEATLTLGLPGARLLKAGRYQIECREIRRDDVARLPKELLRCPPAVIAVVNPGDDAPPNVDPTDWPEGGWGPEVNGMQLRLNAKSFHNPGGKVPGLFMDLRNFGEEKMRFVRGMENFEIEVDGVWYRAGVFRTGWVDVLPLGPGNRWQDVVWSPNLQLQWVDKDGNALAFGEDGHTIRVAITVDRQDGEEGKRVRLVSNAIKPKPADSEKQIADDAGANAAGEDDPWSVEMRRLGRLEIKEAGRDAVVRGYEALIAAHQDDPRIGEAMMAIAGIYGSISIPEMGIEQDRKKSKEWLKQTVMVSPEGSPAWIEAHFLLAEWVPMEDPELSRMMLIMVRQHAKDDSLVLIRTEHGLMNTYITEQDWDAAVKHGETILKWYDEPQRIPEAGRRKTRVDNWINASARFLVYQLERAQIDSDQRSALMQRLRGANAVVMGQIESDLDLR